jgi:glutamate racemase
MACSGDTITYPYTEKSKEELLKNVLDKHYKMDKRFVEVEQHPTIRIY